MNSGVELCPSLDGIFSISSPGGEKGRMLNHSPVANDLTKHTYVMKPPYKPKRTNFERFWVDEHMEIELSCPFFVTCPMHLLHFSFLVISFYKKPGNLVSDMLLWITWVALLNELRPRRSHWNAQAIQLISTKYKWQTGIEVMSKVREGESVGLRS